MPRRLTVLVLPTASLIRIKIKRRKMDETAAKLHLFEGFGIELEYMIVDRESLDVKPIADKLLSHAAGEPSSDFDDGLIGWSNELALHVIELKTNGPATSIAICGQEFRRSLNRLSQIAECYGARLMPTAMHPWMNPIEELRLWPHDYNPIYEAYNRIFDCRGHGWANLQSMHINLPFADDDEFGRLHAAVRLVLPILPALAASSPFADRRQTGFQDYRMEVYRHNSALIPSIAGLIIPEQVFTQADYQREIFETAYRDIAPYDPDGILQEPFLNSRGAIARFERGSIEIRVIDVQECPEVDLAIAETVIKLVQLLVSESIVTYQHQKLVETKPLSDIFVDVIRDADQAVIHNRPFLAALGMRESSATANEIWKTLLSRLIEFPFAEPLTPAAISIVEKILDFGPLSRRVSKAVDNKIERLPAIYDRLCDCLLNGKMFTDESHGAQ